MSEALAKQVYSLRSDLAATASGWRHIKAAPGAWMAAEFLVRMGIECEAQSLPAKYSKMTEKYCFDNVSKLVGRRTGLRYCEGYIARDDFPIPIHHAWAIDWENRVIDPTLREPERYAYLGYPIALAKRKRWLSSHSLSVLDTGSGINFKFMLHECPELFDLIDVGYRGFIKQKIKREEGFRE
jgi:hypothetical protein